ncbi:MAG: dephospho-CoA kinase [Candidatus Competibacteraceae bacterium]|nr:dephospho-CoA kinase [Candidatus Competibacteraceae bacterium]MBK7982812.1 dephospho-CoA kinase [Candidatus Competibacteraceae bacterium]MBK8898641.1 dephospho-CoA kinase [Candidatus Competibacteraceae bacterium]MBK8962441.1 dephospho-CoA kinase [Candidatus Competibacteraceae bacterium]MBK9951658.1 dephospho-CoA kinase [Candidatus Competibacteraceae bacterium]
MLVVGLTGGIGSGKTAVSDRFGHYGVPVIDTDQLARELVEPGQPALAEIAKAFGPACLDEQGQLRRDHLRERVFADPASRRQLEAILHPRIRAAMQARVAALATPYCLVVIPLLVETGMRELVDRVLVVDVSEIEQIRRVMRRDEISEEQARRILAAQVRRDRRLALADDVLENTGDFDALNHQIAALHERYLALASTRAA